MASIYELGEILLVFPLTHIDVLLCGGKHELLRMLPRKEMHNRIYVFYCIMSRVALRPFSLPFIVMTQFHRVTER